MAMPPTMRQITKAAKLCVQPVNTDEIANKNAARISSFLRPKRSLAAPDAIDPIRHPTRAQLLAQPISVSELR